MRFTSPIVGVVAVVALSLTLAISTVRADDSAPTPAAAPIPSAASSSSSSLPMGAFFNPTRMSFHQSIEIGASTGGYYRGTAGLYTASFGYKLASPLSLNLDLGAAYTPGTSASSLGYGSAAYNPGFSGLFVKNFSLDWRPGANSLVRFSYHDVRSPLQYQGFGSPYSPYYGFEPYDPSGVEQPSHN